MTLNNGNSPNSSYSPSYLYQIEIGGGIVIQGGASSNRIGTDGQSADDIGERNMIAGSGNDGVDIYGPGTDDNIVAGNFIGTDFTGTNSLGIAKDGVFIVGGASDNWVGVNPDGDSAFGDKGNLISGNGDDGVQIEDGSNGNVIAGNKIGTDVTGGRRARQRWQQCRSRRVVRG
jgi:hypothetical protein